jgi:uncharacterized protein (TIGR03437 family)
VALSELSDCSEVVPLNMRSFQLRTALLTLALFALPISAQITPKINSAIGSAASWGFHSIAYGSIFSIFGTNLAGNAVQAMTLPFPTQLGGTEVNVCAWVGPGPSDFSSCVLAPLLYVSPGQINAIMPGPPTNNTGDLHIENRTLFVLVNGNTSPALSPPIYQEYPAVYRIVYDCALPNSCTQSSAQDAAWSTSGRTIFRGAVVDLSGKLVSSLNPIRLNTDYSIYLTGLGWNPANRLTRISIGPGGCPNCLPGYYNFTIIPSLDVPTSYVGLSGTPGLNQINFRLPQSLWSVLGGPTCSSVNATGHQVEMTLSVFYNPPNAPANLAMGDMIYVPVSISSGELNCDGSQ